MGEAAEHFITQFHSLPGGTVKEKHKNLFCLLRQNSSLTKRQKDLDFIVANLKPTNHLEKIFHIDFLIYFQRFSELYENFKRGDDITLSKVSKQDWFYQNVIKELSVDDFVNKILPTLSHSAKIKILRKLPVEEKQANDIFDALQNRYGLFLATVFLPKCTSSKIRETLKQQPVKFSEAQLKTIYKKDPNLIYVYIEERTKHEGSSAFLNNKPFLVYVAQKNPEIFLDLFNNYKFETKLGRRTTKRFVASQKNDIISKPELFVDILNMSVTVRKIGSKMTSVLFKNCAKRQQLYWKSLLQYYPKNQQFSIYRSTYNAIYHNKFGENVDAICNDELQIIADPKEREKIAKLKQEKEDGIHYLRYFTPENCLKEFMEKVNHLTTSERAKYVDIATDCCVLNENLDGLLKMSELVCGRFKNDDKTIREFFFYSLSKDDKIMDMFNEEHWTLIMEILATADAKNEYVSDEAARTKHLKFLINNNHPIRDTISKYHSWPGLISRSTLEKEPKFFKPIMNELIEVGFTKLGATENEVEYHDCMLAYLCKTYNKHNSEEIPIYNNPRILKSVKSTLENKTQRYVDPQCVEGVEYIVCRPSSSQEMQELKNLYFKEFKSFGRESGMMWFLKHEPKTVQDNLDQFLTNFVDIWRLYPRRIWRFIKKCAFLELDKRTVEFCKEKLAQKEYKHKKELVRALSMLASPDSYLEMIKPTLGKVDLTDEDVKDLHSVQTLLIKSMHALNAPTKVLPMALEFCRSVYLRSALSPLYSCFHKLPENESRIFVDKLKENKAVSVKKHVISISCAIHDAHTVYTCLKNTTDLPLVAALKYFVKNPSDDLWKLIETEICSLDKKHLHVLKGALDVTIPYKYKSKYLEIIWKVLDKYENKEIKKTLVTKLDKESIQNFDSEFAFQIVRSSIFKLEEANDLVADLLIYLNDDKKFSVFSDILNRLKESTWSSQHTKREARQKLDKFIQSLFAKYMKAEKSDEKFVSELSRILKETFSICDVFEESIVVSCMAFKNETVEKCAKLLVDLNSHFDRDYGVFAVNLLADTVSNYVFPHVFSTDGEKIELCHSLVKVRGSVGDLLLIMKLLPKNEPEYEAHYLLYSDILKELSQGAHDVVQLQFNLYLKSEELGTGVC